MKGLRPFLVSVLLLAAGSAAFLYSGSFTYEGTIQPGTWIRNLKVPYTVDTVTGYGNAQIYFPKGYEKGKESRTLIMLHGFGQTMKSWENSTNIRHYADTYGFVLVCPDMGKTTYEMKYYPETANKWAVIPGGKFVAEALMKYIRDTFNIGTARDKTGIAGLSTGARGALMIAALYTDDFCAAAGISGDYDPTIMTNDKLLISVYGEFSKFPERWEKDASVINFADKLKNTAIYLSHGGKDSVVSKEQSVIFAIRLKQLHNEHGGYDVLYREKRYKMHDWSFWASTVPEFMRFFDEKLGR